MQEQPDHSTIIGHAALKSLASGIPEVVLGAKSVGMSERCIEVPWFASQLSTSRRLLDVGWSFSPPEWFAVLLQLIDKGVQVQGIDIIDPIRVQSRYPEHLRHKILSVPVLVEDFLQSDLSTIRFDTITCLSTLEHIGIDAPSDEKNSPSAFARARTPETVNFNRHPRTDEWFLDAVARSLAPGGTLLLSVPIGSGREILHRDSLGFYTFQFEFSATAWRRLTRDTRFKLEQEEFYSYSSRGWGTALTIDHLEEQSSELMDFAMGVGVARMSLVGN